MDRRVLLQRQSDAQDSSGQVVGAWLDVCSAWAEFKPISATEEEKVDRRSSVQRATFVIRFRSGIEPTMRVVHDGVPWEILGVREIGRRVAIELDAEAREVGSGGHIGSV